MVNGGLTFESSGVLHSMTCVEADLLGLQRYMHGLSPSTRVSPLAIFHPSSCEKSTPLVFACSMKSSRASDRNRRSTSAAKPLRSSAELLPVVGSR